MVDKPLSKAGLKRVDSSKVSLVFFGSGPVAAAALELLAADFYVEAVVTKPQPPHHKGSVPVLELSERLGLPVYTAANKTELSQLFSKVSFNSPVAVLIDYGIMVEQSVIDYFPLGIVNSHFSLLPQWRGADPITFSILSGQDTTGVSLMLLVKEMDEGPLLDQAEYHLPRGITTPRLTHDLIKLSHELLQKNLLKYITKDIKPYDQPNDVPVTYSSKLTKEDGVINWTKPASDIERQVRAFIEWPKSRSKLGNIDVVITNSEVVASQGQPGDIAINGKNIIVYCGQDALKINKLKPAGKPEMTAEAFLAGYKQHLGQ